MSIIRNAITGLMILFCAGCATTPPFMASQSSGPSPDSSGGATTVPPNFGTDTVSPLWVDPKFQPFADYLQVLIEAVQAEWDRIVASSAIDPPSGTMTSIRFVLNSDGNVSQYEVIENTAGEQGTSECLQAIQNIQPFGTWTDEMIAASGCEQTITFKFFYQ